MMTDLATAGTRLPAAAGDKRLDCRLHFAAVLLLTLAMELLLLYTMVKGALSVGTALLLHVFLLGALFFWWHKLFHHPQGVMRRTLYLFLFSTAVLGPLGVVGTLLVIVLHAGYRRFTLCFEEWYAGLFPEPQQRSAKELAEFLDTRKHLEGAAAPDSFHDIIANGSLQQKRDAIILMSKHFCPDFSRPLRRALVDEDSSIRVMAASTIARIENGFLKKVIQADRAAASAPDDVELLLRQAKLHDDYAFTGLLEPDREVLNRQKARQIYRRILERQPGNRPAALRLGRLLIRMGAVQEAEALLKERVQSGAKEPELLFWYAESLYRQNRYRELRELMQDCGPVFDGEPERAHQRMADVLQAWL